MKTFVQPGEVLSYTAGGTISAGDVVVAGDLLGVAANDAVSGDVIAVHLEGVYTLPKTSGEITVGAVLYWDTTPGEVTTTATGNKPIGFAFETTSGSTIAVKLAPALARTGAIA